MAKRSLFPFRIDDRHFALDIAAVDRVVGMVEFHSLPYGAAGLLGMVTVQGDLLPVADLRPLLGLAARPLTVSDVLIFCHGGGSRFAIAAAEVEGVLDVGSGEIQDAGDHAGGGAIAGLIHRFDRLLVLLDPVGIASRCSMEPEGEGTPPERGALVELAGSGGAPREEARARMVLRERTRRLAGVENRGAGGELQLVEFTLAGQPFGLETQFVKEVGQLRQLTPLPGTPPFVAGIVNLRGTIVSVVDLRSLFELDAAADGSPGRIIVLGDGGMEFALLAASIVGVRGVATAELKPSLPTLTGSRGEYLKGVAGQRVAVLDGGKLLADRRLVVNRDV
ncbi:chemotaxis protein CheW [Geomonas sp. Red32]|uniref:chemotaxis protein CheW n=1 Tax=Geomonas sp. Red32 TaxID=2912856 RepID=UPI00202CA72B|nr:chemotaxis protein CheW [Geomonas sp. Red32]MCM0083291.1 chemotaxis protein CheW [Geomonas sp. Red32]